MKQQDKHNYRPYYDRRRRRWRVEFPDRDAEEGDILYVACEYARTGLFFPYNDSSSKEQGWQPRGLGLESGQIGFRHAGLCIWPFDVGANRTV